MIQCPNCHASISETAVFCPDCGTKVPTAEVLEPPAATTTEKESTTVAPSPNQPESEATASAPVFKSYTPPSYTAIPNDHANSSSSINKDSTQPVIPSQKKRMSKWIYIVGGILGVVIIALILVRLFNVPGKASDPNAGVYQAVSAEMWGIKVDVNEVFDGGFLIELKDNGKCRITVGTDAANGKWTLDGEKFEVKGGGISCVGTLGNGLMVLENVLDSGILLTLQREKGADVSNPESAFVNNGAASEGRYVITALETGETLLSLSELRASGLDGAYLLLNADGSGEICFVGLDPTPITWDEHSIHYSTLELPIDAAQDQITVDLSGVKTTYTLEENVATIDVPSKWYGWISLTDFWGNTQEDTVYDAIGYIGTEAESNKSYLEIYRQDTPDSSVFSMYITLNDRRTLITPNIGSEDAWMLETYLSADDADQIDVYLNADGSLVLRYDYTHYDESYGCHIEMFLRPDGSIWNESSDILPPGYQSYKEAIPEPSN